MSTTVSSFYVTGGTLRSDAPSYVERRADRDLYEGLTRGEFCYVLTARQMGKSSLMVRTAARLREEGVAVVVLDLTTVGQNLSAEQWYDGLLALMGQQLDLEEELDDFWLNHPRLGPLQRWLAALREVVLARVPGRIVLFVDEIDTVRGLPFSTDEFFAGIRECYNRRTQDPMFERLTFGLLGVASPSDLIRDTRTTPFNIGQRIELTDFTQAEAAPLAAGLGRKEPIGTALLERVLSWTGGHPYLTQRLCQAVAADSRIAGPADIDHLCEALFFTARARERDDNLLFVRERVLHSEADRASLLTLYEQVRRGKRVADDEANALAALLRLSGIVRSGAPPRSGGPGRLRVRNRIYERVFDTAWVRASMPDAELRRQRAAYRRGLLRATAVAALILAAMAGLALIAVSQARRAGRIARQEAQQRTRAERLLYVADIGAAQQAIELGNFGHAVEMLKEQMPGPGQEDRRGFEWRYLWRLCKDQSLKTFRGQTGMLYSVAFSPDGKLLATGSEDEVVTLWDVASGQPIAAFKGAGSHTGSLAFSPDGKLLAAGTMRWSVTLWDVPGKRELATLSAPGRKRTKGGLAVAVAFSSDGKTLAAARMEGVNTVLWNAASQRAVGILRGDPKWIYVSCIAFSPNGKTLAVCGGENTSIKLWDVPTQQEVATLTFQGQPDWVSSVSFSPDGRRLAAGGAAKVVRIWDLASRRVVATLPRGSGDIWALEFSPDGKTLASGSMDNRVTLWDEVTGRKRATLHGHDRPITGLAFSPDGKTLATASWDRTAKLWDASAKQEERSTLQGHQGPVDTVAFSPDGKTLMTGSEDRTVKLWDLATHRAVAALPAQRYPTDTLSGSVALSPDGKILTSGSSDNTVKLWDVATRREVATLKLPEGIAPLPLAFSPEGQLATGNTDATVSLWNVATRQEMTRLHGHGGEVFGVIFSPDGRTLASANQDQTVTLWDVVGHPPMVRGRELATLTGHHNWVDCMAFSPDGKTLATGSWDKAVKLWNVVTRRETATLQGHTGYVRSVAFSPDGSILASGGADNMVRLWRAPTLAETDAPAGARVHPTSR